MKIHRTSWGRGVLFGTAALAFCAWQAGAQSTAARSGGEQNSRVAARVLDTVDDTNRTRLRGNVHPMARPEFDRGTVADAQPLTRILLLLQRSAEQEAALRQLMEEQQSKISANYHAWLTPENFGKKFGPADADVQAVTDWLNSHGFQNIKVAKGKTVVEFSGNVGQVRNAFGAEIRNFNVKGEDHFANVSDPQIPAALAPVVRGVVALHNFRPQPQVHSLGTFQRNAKTGEVKPAFTFTDVNGTFYAMGPADFATIYNIPAASTGLGQHIAIVGQSNINLQDVIDFRSIFGLPAYSPGQLNVILNGPDPGLVSGDEGESDLDVEWAGAVAPGATIDFVVTQSSQTDVTSGIDGSALYIIDNNIAPILSESYGACESALGAAGNQFYNNLWQQAAAEGITVVISAGDNGAAGCDNPNGAAASGVAVSGLASTPYNVATGGTDFDDATTQTTFWNAANTSTSPPVLASAKGYIPEITWNDSCAVNGITGCAGLSSTAASVNSVAGSGGPSNCATFTAGGACSAGYAKPSWQLGVTPTDGTRDIPDVSFFSSDGHNKSFYIVCQSDQDITGDTGCSLTKFTSTSPFHDFQAVGGTSAATPTFAGIIALINQVKGGPQGNANYALYNTYSVAKAAGKVCDSSSFSAPSTSNLCVFYDTTKGNVSVACVGGSPNCSNTSAAANQFGALIKTGTTLAFNTSGGYDLATGLGSVNVANLIAAWAPPSHPTPAVTLATTTTFPITVGSPASFSGSVSAAGGTPTGLVILENASTRAAIDTATLSAGSYSLNTQFLSGGVYNVIAHYGGDGGFLGNDSAQVAVNVSKQNSVTVMGFVTAAGTITTSAQSVAYGSNYILRIDVENAAGQTCENINTGAISFICPTGKVSITDNGTALNDFPNAQNPNVTNVAALNDRGFAEDQPVQLSAGNHNIAASYPGDTSYNASSSNTLAVTITKATTTSAVVSSPASIASGGSVTLTATVSSSSNSSAGPSGTVQFMNGAATLGGAMTCAPAGATASTRASCKATLTTALSEVIPMAQPRLRPSVPMVLVGIMSSLLLVFLALQRHLSFGRRVGYTAAGLLLLACLTLGFAGCSGSKGSGSTGGAAHTDSITAVYSGDTNYSGSTSAAVSVSIQ